MTEGQEFTVVRALVPALDDRGDVVLEPGEARIGSLPARGVRFRFRAGDTEQHWGPLDMRVALTTRRIVLVAARVPTGTRWSPTGSVPFALCAIEPPQSLRCIAPVRVAGHLRWDHVTRVDADGGRLTISVPPSPDAIADLALHVPRQLGHRIVAIARAAFVNAKRTITSDSDRRVEAPTA